MRFASALVLLASCIGITAAGQQPPAAAPKKKEKVDAPPGYKAKKIQGFTFLVSEKVFEADVSKYELKPFEVLELECKTLERILSHKAVDLLRNLTVWVEWDESIAARNGRQGVVLASYYGGSPQSLAREGMHPLQAKTVTIHSMKALTEGRQPKRDKGECLLLHEFAHAVHDQLFGDRPDIQAAYQQAMARKLYDKDLYAATNHREFFAEMTCAYLDKLGYFPQTADDLKKHDPATYKLMESLWGPARSAAAKAAARAVPKVAATAPAVTLAKDVRFGKTLAGPDPAADRLAGKVVLVGYWGAEFSNALNRLDRLNTELSPYGLVVVAPYAYRKDAEQVVAEAAKRAGGGIAVLEKAGIRNAEGTAIEYPDGGSAYIFDAAGACVFGGKVFDADGPARAAVGKSLLDAAAGEGGVPKGLKPVADALGGGAAPPTVLPKLLPLTTGGDDETKPVAKKLYDRIAAPGQALLTEAKAMEKTDPVAAYLAAEKVAGGFKGSPLAARATALMENLRPNKAVATELKARTLLAQMEKAAGFLRGQEGSFNPSDPRFQAKHRATIAQLQAAVEQMKKQYPAARATAEAEKVVREFAP